MKQAPQRLLTQLGWSTRVQPQLVLRPLFTHSVKGMEWSGIERNSTEWNANKMMMDWNALGLEYNTMECNGMGCKGKVECNGMQRKVMQRVLRSCWLSARSERSRPHGACAGGLAGPRGRACSHHKGELEELFFVKGRNDVEHPTPKHPTGATRPAPHSPRTNNKIFGHPTCSSIRPKLSLTIKFGVFGVLSPGKVLDLLQGMQKEMTAEAQSDQEVHEKQARQCSGVFSIRN